MKTPLVIGALLCLIVATGLAQGPGPGGEPQYIRSCIETSCNNMWESQQGSATFACGIDCEGGCYHCQGNVIRTFCVVNEGPNNDCLYGWVPEHINCGRRFRVPCDVNPIGGCQCNEDPNVPSVHVGDCLIKRCINASP